MIQITANFKSGTAKVLHDVSNVIVDFKPMFSYDNEKLLKCQIETDKDIRIIHADGVLIIAKNTLETLEICQV